MPFYLDANQAIGTAESTIGYSIDIATATNILQLCVNRLTIVSEQMQHRQSSTRRLSESNKRHKYNQ